jgi:hypothetical protein
MKTNTLPAFCKSLYNPAILFGKHERLVNARLMKKTCRAGRNKSTNIAAGHILHAQFTLQPKVSLLDKSWGGMATAIAVFVMAHKSCLSKGVFNEVSIHFRVAWHAHFYASRRCPESSHQRDV